MTIYTFDQASRADANAFTTGDFLHFASGLPTDLTASYEFGSALTADRITLTLAGKSLTFNADALQQGDAIDFRTDGVSRGSIMVLGPQADSVSVFSATNKAIWTFGGDDHVVIAGAGTIHLHTGAGNDSIDVDNVVLPGGALGQTGRFLIDAGDGDDLIALHMANGPTDAWGGGGNDTIEGSAGNDHLYGNAADAVAGAVDGADSIDAGAGNDYVHANGGDDLVNGGDGNDRLYGGQGEDVIYGGQGNDWVQGNKGADLLSGNAGNDTIHGGTDDDMLSGGSGNDRLFGDNGNDNLTGGAGIDTLMGGAGLDLFRFKDAEAAFDPHDTAGAVDRIEDFTIGVDHIGLNFAVATVIVDPAPLAFSTMGAAAAHAEMLMAGHAGNHEVVAVAVGGDTLLFYGHDGGEAVDSAVRLAGIDYRTVGLDCFS